MKSGDLVVDKTTGVHGIVLSAADSKVFIDQHLTKDYIVRVLFHGKPRPRPIMASALRKANV